MVITNFMEAQRAIMKLNEFIFHSGASDETVINMQILLEDTANKFKRIEREVNGEKP